MLEVKKGDILELNDDVVIHGIPELEKFWAFNLKTGDQYSLSESAYFLLTGFDEPGSIETAADRMANEYNISNEIAEQDCLDIISQYLDEGLLKIKR
jgi:hypothetical protein